MGLGGLTPGGQMLLKNFNSTTRMTPAAMVKSSKSPVMMTKQGAMKGLASSKSSSPSTRLRLEFKEDLEEESGLMEETIMESCQQQVTPILICFFS